MHVCVCIKAVDSSATSLNSSLLCFTHIHRHTYTIYNVHIYTTIFVCVCVCVGNRNSAGTSMLCCHFLLHFQRFCLLNGMKWVYASRMWHGRRCSAEAIRVRCSWERAVELLTATKAVASNWVIVVVGFCAWVRVCWVKKCCPAFAGYGSNTFVGIENNLTVYL